MKLRFDYRLGGHRELIDLASYTPKVLIKHTKMRRLTKPFKIVDLDAMACAQASVLILSRSSPYKKRKTWYLGDVDDYADGRSDSISLSLLGSRETSMATSVSTI